MKTNYNNIDSSDARTYVIPIANIIGKRLNRISILNSKLVSFVTKLYMIPDNEDKTEICEEIEKTISEIETLILKNIDDSQILEYSLAEFTLKLPLSEKLQQESDIISDQHTYFA
jgi:hypothetical protein